MPDPGDYYISTDGSYHSSASEAIGVNQSREGDMSRGASGGCDQDADNASGGQSSSDDSDSGSEE